MTRQQPAARRPWWRKTRWRLALAAWLILAYPVTIGPLAYGFTRDWFPVERWNGVAAPVRVAEHLFPALRPTLEGYLEWWQGLARRPAAPH